MNEKINYSDLIRIDQLLPCEVYTCKLNLGTLKKVYREIIDKEGDKQNQSTNIKADMTDWKLNQKYHELDPLVEVFSDIYLKIQEIYHFQYYQNLISYYGNGCKFTNTEIWGARYKSREKTVPHHHEPAIMSMCLYIKTPKGCPGLSFNEVSKTIPVEEDQMIIFRSSVMHSVKSKKFKGKRYILAGNLLFDQGEVYSKVGKLNIDSAAD